MLVDKEVVHHFKLRDGKAKICITVSATRCRVEAGDYTTKTIVDFDIDMGGQRLLVDIVETVLEQSSSVYEFFFNLLTNPHVPSYFGRAE